MEEIPAMECETCGGTDFHKESGHFYCNECQTQSQQVQEHVFEQEDGAINKKSTKKIQKEKSGKAEEVLTSWECYNYILKGLTEELVDLGAKPELREVVCCLWMKYLHKCEVFDIKSDTPPKISILGPKKDLRVLGNVKKRRRARSRASSTSTSLSVQRQRSRKKRALIHSQYEELSQSQAISQDTSLMTDTLSSLKSGSEASKGSGKIRYNRFSKRELKRMMSADHGKKHMEDIEGELTCHKLRARSFRPNFSTGPANLTVFTLYSILYIGLLIIGDEIQLGDLLRFIREGHLSFACFRHFFDENISDKVLSLPQRREKLFSHRFFRKRCAKIAHFLDASSYVCAPSLIELCSRYCSELGLPKEVCECVKKLIIKSAPKMAFNQRSKEVPNYEGRAMSFILFTLKLLFGLDGVTEIKLSEYAVLLNGAECATEMFNFCDWLQFIGYRNVIMKHHHIPSALRDCKTVNSDMYLKYLETQNIKFKGSSRHVHSEVKDYLQVLDKILMEDNQDYVDEIVYEPSLTPFLSYSQAILNNKDVPCRDVLSKNFKEHSLKFVLRSGEYFKAAENQSVKNGGANDNIVIEDMLYLYKTTIFAQRKSKKTVAVKISDDIEEDQFIDEYLESEQRKSLQTTDVAVLLSNWQKGNEREFAVNEKSLKVLYGNLSSGNVKNVTLYNAFERYWLNVPTNPLAHYFPKHDMEAISDKLPHTFVMLLNECSRIIEQDMSDFFSEFLVTELYLVYLADFACKNKKNKCKGIHELRTTLANCSKHW